MSLVFAASVPHSPLLLPKLGADHHEAMSRTHQTYRDIAERLRAARPDTLLLVSSHGVEGWPNVTIHSRPKFALRFTEFGDFDTTINVPGNVHFANELKKPFDAQRHHRPLMLTSYETLDYGLSTPLYLFQQHIGQLPAVPMTLTVPKPGPEYHLGQDFYPIVQEFHGRVAVVASANLSHRLSPASPAGESPRARAFDRRVLHAIDLHQHQVLQRFHSSTLEDVQPCGLGALLFLLGFLSTTKYESRLLSYEAPFGIGLPIFHFAF